MYNTEGQSCEYVLENNPMYGWQVFDAFATHRIPSSLFSYTSHCHSTLYPTDKKVNIHYTYRLNGFLKQ